jgi:CRISPR system Cascade subunit CasA
MRDIIPQCWYEGSMPLIVIEDHLMDDFVRVVSEAINMANSISYNLGSSLKRALTKEVTVGQGASADTLAQKGFKGTSLSNSADLRFWTSTESEFYNTLEKTKVFVEAGESCADALKDWHRILADRSLAIFDEIAASGAIEDEDPRRISLARLQLINFNYSKKLMERLKNL